LRIVFPPTQQNAGYQKRAQAKSVPFFYDNYHPAHLIEELLLLCRQFMAVCGEGFAEGSVRPASRGIYMTSAAGKTGLLSICR
jgi:hypothetical protein